MQRTQIVKKVKAAATGVATLDYASLADIPAGYGLCGIKPSAAITSVTAYVTMSQDGTTFSGIEDATGIQLSVTIAAARYKSLPVTDYAVLDKFMRLEFNTGISAACEFELFFRPVA